MDVLSQRLNKLLKENKITMYKLAKDFNCSKATITNWCYSLSDPKAPEIVKLAQYFEVSADYLLGLEDENGGKTININNVHNSFNGNNKF